MTTILKKQCGTMLLLFILIHTQAQDRAQDHNSSRSNKTASKALSDDWTFGVTTDASFAVRSNEGSLFRGNSLATKLYSRYHFGNIGLGFSSGFVPGNINSSTLNTFMVKRKFQQVQIIKSNPFNSYLLFGPSFRFGNRVMVVAEIQGGMFVNNPGSVTIAQAGANRTLYRFEGAEKNSYPGFSGNICLAYPINNSTRFVVNTGYLHSKSSIRLYDPQQGIDVPVDQERRISLFGVGVGITKSFGAKREAGSGMATGKKHMGNVKWENRLAGGGEIPGERIITTTQRHAINTKGTGATNGRILNDENCGPVTQTITNPDGTSNELLFACPDDAAVYNERTNKTVTVPKQTQGTTFGEKVNAGLHAAGSALAQGASRGVISGSVSWSANNSAGIITNQDAVSSVGHLAGAGSGAAAASYAATGRVIPSSTSPAGIAATIFSRETGSGMATGKRSSRDAGSGMATGRRQYQPVYNEGETNTCTDCAVTVKLVAHEAAHVVQQSAGLATHNPLYTDNGHQGTNPLYEGKGSLRTGGDNDCDGVAGLSVFLIDINNGAVVANTKTTNCGDFFFANVPSASYLIKISGSVSRTKTYEATITSKGKVDMAGELKVANDHWVIQLNTENNNVQKAGISTSRSNIRTRSITIIETNQDGNSEFAPAKVIMEFTDGSSADVTSKTKITATAGSKKVTVRGWNPEKKEKQINTNSSIAEYTISMDGDNAATLVSQYDNGTKKETRVISKVSHHSHVIQWIIPVDDTNTDAAVIKTKTKSNQSNDRMADATNGGNNSSKSYTKELPVFVGDMDNDGTSEIFTGNTFAASNVIGQGASLLGSAMPGGAVISAFVRPGSPIGGIIVKGGKNPGGSFRTTQTNEQGEFEFAGMEKGAYLISADVTYYVDDETIVTVGDDEDSEANETADRKGWDGTVKGGSKTDEKLDDGKAARKGWDGTVKGGSKTDMIENDGPSAKKSAAQDHNSSRSNKTASIADDSQGDGTAKSIVNTTKSNTKDFLLALDELDHLLNADKMSSASALRAAKENSRLVRHSYQALENRVQNSRDIENLVNEADASFAVLLGSVSKLSQRYRSILNVLKTKHDTAKNSVGNIR